MTFADRLEAALREQGPLPECVLATAVQKRKVEVSAELRGNPDRFVHNGMKARASRWTVREVVNGVDHLTWPAGYDEGEEALVELVRTGRRTPEDALVLVVCAVNGSA